MPRTSAVLLAISLAAAAPATAQSSDPVLATELFKQARAAMAHEDYATAAMKLADSVRLDEKVGTLLNLAECEERLGRVAAARQHLQRAIDLSRALADDRIALAESRLAAVDKRVPRLTVTLAAGAPGDASVRRDDVPLGAGSLGTALPVEPGRHAVTVTAKGRETTTLYVSVTEGEQKSVEVAPGAVTATETSGPQTAPPPGVPPEDAVPSAHSNLGTIGLIGGGAGVVIMGVGAAFGLLAISKNSQSKQTCDTNNVCDPGGKALRDDALTDGNVSTVAFVVGAAALATGAVLYLIAPSTASTRTTGRLEAAPLVSPHGGGLALSGAW